jgi:hypothetical protein
MTKSTEEYIVLINRINTLNNPVEWFECLEKIGTTASSIVNSMTMAGLDEMIDTAKCLISVINTKNPQVNAITAIILGALVENGMTPKTVDQALIKEFTVTLKLADEFICFIKETIPAISDEEIKAINDEAGGYLVGKHYISAEQARALWKDKNRLVQGYQAIDQFTCSAVAIFSADQSLTKKYNNNDFNKLIKSHSLDFIRMLINTLHDEDVIVLHPTTSQGFKLKINGISDNFQLHTLLADALAYNGEGPDWGIPAERPSSNIISVMNGTGPQSCDAVSKGIWNLYNWTVIIDDELEQADSEQWICDDGIPADIQSWEGTRTIVLGPTTNNRTWNTGRSIPHMTPSILIEKVLKKNEVHDILEKIRRR